MKEPIEVRLQITAFADMTLPEILKLMAEQRREAPDVTEFHDDQVMRTRLHRYNQITEIGVEHNLARSYSTVAECKAMAKAVFSGARVIRSEPQAGTTRPGEITRLQPSYGVYKIGGDEMLIDGLAEAADPANETPVSITSRQKPEAKPVSQPSALPRPKNLKGFE